MNKKIPAIAGIGGNDLRPVLDKLYLAESIGVDAVLVVSPAYSKPTPSGIYKYYAKIAESTHLPIILYNVPGRTASSIPLETINKLQNEYPHIIGIKEASGDLERTMSIIHSTPSWFKVYCGDDFLALASMLVGADGCISVVSNQIPGPFKNLVHLALNGNVREARRIHYNYFNLMTMNFIETNPIPVKTSLHLMGLCEPYFRLPLDNMTSENKKELKKLLTRLDLILPAENHLMKLPAG